MFAIFDHYSVVMWAHLFLPQISRYRYYRLGLRASDSLYELLV